MDRFWNKVDKSAPNGCWVWTASKTQRGYGSFRLDARMQSAHRVSWVLANGPIPDGLCVCHKCDNPLCVNPDHLFLGTHQDNMADKVQKGRHAPTQGELHGRAKLTERCVHWIRMWYDLGHTQQSIADAYGVAQSVISHIVNRKRWRHI